MANQEEHAIKSESFDFSDETLRAYLLGRLGEAERSQLDQRLLTDDSLAERVRLAESQMVDEYAAGELGGAERELLKRKFLTTEARRQNVRLSAALQSYSQSEFETGRTTEKSEPAWLESIAGFFSSKPSAAWAAAGSFALLILVLGGAWLLTMRRPSGEPLITRQTPTPAISPEAAASPAIAQVPPPSSPAKPDAKPTPEPAPPIAVASAVLLPGALRGEGEMARVAVPRGEGAIVRLSLVLETPGAGVYQAELATADGKTVAVRNRLPTHKNGNTKVTFEVPARLVQTGDYQVKLSRKADGQSESVGRYYFRALQE